MTTYIVIKDPPVIETPPGITLIPPDEVLFITPDDEEVILLTPVSPGQLVGLKYIDLTSRVPRELLRITLAYLDLITLWYVTHLSPHLCEVVYDPVFWRTRGVVVPKGQNPFIAYLAKHEEEQEEFLFTIPIRDLVRNCTGKQISVEDYASLARMSAYLIKEGYTRHIWYGVAILEELSTSLAKTYPDSWANVYKLIPNNMVNYFKRGLLKSKNMPLIRKYIIIDDGFGCDDAAYIASELKSAELWDFYIEQIGATDIGVAILFRDRDYKTLRKMLQHRHEDWEDTSEIKECDTITREATVTILRGINVDNTMFRFILKHDLTDYWRRFVVEEEEEEEKVVSRFPQKKLPEEMSLEEEEEMRREMQEEAEEMSREIEEEELPEALPTVPPRPQQIFLEGDEDNYPEE